MADRLTRLGWNAVGNRRSSLKTGDSFSLTDGQSPCTFTEKPWLNRQKRFLGRMAVISAECYRALPTFSKSYFWEKKKQTMDFAY